MKILIPFLFVMNVYAQDVLLSNGNGVGNGGDAVLCGGKVELLDFVEARMKGEKLKFESGDDYKAIVDKVLTRLSKVDEKLANQYKKVFLRLSSRLKFVPNADFRDVPDSLQISLPKGCRIEQLAIQRAENNVTWINISQDLWDKLDSPSKAGLVLHEIIYEHFLLLGEKDSIKARGFNTFLNSEKILKITKSDYQKMTREMGIKLY